MLSWVVCCSGVSRYSITRRVPVFTSAVTTIPGANCTALPFTSLVFRANRLVAGRIAPHLPQNKNEAVPLGQGLASLLQRHPVALLSFAQLAGGLLWRAIVGFSL